MAAIVAACLAVLLVWLLMPHFVLGEGTQRSWLDQSILLASLENLVAPGQGDPDLARIGTGPAYLAAARLLVVLGLSPAGALVALSGAALAVSLLLVLTSAMVSRRGRIAASWPAFACVTVLGLMVPTAFLSGIPWTHFPATALALGCVVGVRVWNWRPIPAAALMGLCLAALLQTRNLEAQAVLLALAPVVAVGMVRQRSTPHRAPWMRAAAVGVAGCAAAWVVAGTLGGTWAPYSQYSVQWTPLDRQLSVESLLVAAPQVLIDPCYRALCDSDPAAARSVVPTGLEAWRAPLVQQLPSLLVATVAAWTLVLVRLWVRQRVPPDVWVALTASAVLTVGYLANPIMGGPHLRYGVVRDFVLPALLAVYAVGRLLAVRHARPGRGWRPFVLPCVLCGSAIALAALPPVRLEADPVIDYRVEAADCADWPCSPTVTIVRASGHEEPERGTLVFVPICDGQMRKRIAADQEVPSDCRGAIEVGVLPRSLGAWQTPEGDALLRSHTIVLAT